MLNYDSFNTNDVIEDSIDQEYLDWSKSDDPEADYFDAWNYIAGDHFFSCPAMLETRYHAMAAEYDIYQYFFTHVPSISFGINEFYNPGWLGAGHAEELAFVFWVFLFFLFFFVFCFLLLLVFFVVVVFFFFLVSL